MTLSTIIFVKSYNCWLSPLQDKFLFLTGQYISLQIIRQKSLLEDDLWMPKMQFIRKTKEHYLFLFEGGLFEGGLFWLFLVALQI